MHAVIQVIDFPLHATLRLERGLRERAVILVDATASKPSVIGLTERARRGGVESGLSVAQAMARCPEVLTRYRSSGAEALARRALFDAAYAISPRVEESGDGLCAIDLRGVDRTTLEAQLQAAWDRLRRWGLPARIGVAETPDLAWLVAKRAGRVLRVAGENAALNDFLDTLPISELEISEGLEAILEQWGVRTAGSFARLSRQAVAERLGAEGVRLWDRLSGRDGRPLRISEPPEEYEESLDFEYDIVSLEPVLFVARRFLDQLTARLVTAQRVAESLSLELKLDRAEPLRFSMKVPDPTSDAEVLFRMLAARLENAEAEEPVVAIRLRIEPTKRLGRQLGLFETALRNPGQLARTLARVAGIVGEDRVGRPVLIDDGRPDGFRLERLLAETSNLEDLSRSRERYGFALRRFRPAPEARVQLEGKRVAWVSSGPIQGSVVDSRGPWMHSGCWWEPRGWNRVEWDVQLRQGGIYRLVREGQRWTVEGEYD